MRNNCVLLSDLECSGVYTNILLCAGKTSGLVRDSH